MRTSCEFCCCVARTDIADRQPPHAAAICGLWYTHGMCLSQYRVNYIRLCWYPADDTPYPLKGSGDHLLRTQPPWFARGHTMSARTFRMLSRVRGLMRSQPPSRPSQLPAARQRLRAPPATASLALRRVPNAQRMHTETPQGPRVSLQRWRNQAMIRRIAKSLEAMASPPCRPSRMHTETP